MKTLGNVAIIVLGVVIASFGEIKFEFWGFVFQIGGIVTEALRLVLVQRLLSSADFKMDPLVSLYYYAPACAATNVVFTLFVEGPRITMNDIYSIGPVVLLANAMVAFLLNVSSVLLVRSSPQTLGLPFADVMVTIDRPNLRRGPDHVRGSQGHPAGLRVHAHLPRPRHRSAILWLLHRPRRPRLLQARRRQDAVPRHGRPPVVRRLPAEEPREDEAPGDRQHRARAVPGVLDVGSRISGRVRELRPERGRIRRQIVEVR